MVVAECVHDDVSTGPAVVNVSHDVEAVDGKTLYELAHGYDEVVGTPCGDYRGDNLVEVGMFVGVCGRLVKEFLDNIAESLRESLVYFGPGVFRRYVLCHFHQTVEGDFIPFGHVCLLLSYKAELLVRVVDKCTQVFQVRVAQGIAENFRNLAFYGAGGVF